METDSPNFLYNIEYSIWFVVVLVLVLPILFIALLLNWYVTCSKIIFPDSEIICTRALFFFFFGFSHPPRLLIVSMPMYKTIIHVVMILYKNPKSIEIVDDYALASGHTVLLCIFRSFNLYYLR